MDKYSASRNLGFFTGPLILGLGIFSYMRGGVPQALSITMIIIGCIRIGLTIYSYILSKKENQE